MHCVSPRPYQDREPAVKSLSTGTTSILVPDAGNMRSIEDTIIIDEILKDAVDATTSLRLGIGDDTAIFNPPAGRELLLTTDQVIEGTHFLPDLHPAQALGHKCLARGLSDIAAMGGEPRCFLLSLCLPAWVTPAWRRRFFKGLFRLSRAVNLPLAGGDIARGGHFSADVTVVGSVRRGRALLRGRAKAGDTLYVSGRLGGSALGIERLQTTGRTRGAAVRRHLYPEPRLALGRFLAEELRIRAAMDLSDGLSTDLGRFLAASHAGATIHARQIPRFRGASLDQALHGGEDYELLFAAPPNREVPDSVDGLELTPFGTVEKGEAIVLETGDGGHPLQRGGFQHFESSS